MTVPQGRPYDIAWLKSQHPEWSFTVKNGKIRAERPGYPVETSGSDTLMSLVILGLEAWECRDDAEGKALHRFP